MAHPTASESDPGTMVNGAITPVQSRADFLAVVQTLLRDLQDRPEEWANADLSSFLEAVGAWIEDMDGYYQNLGRPVPGQPTWQVLAEMLLAAKVYE